MALGEGGGEQTFTRGLFPGDVIEKTIWFMVQGEPRGLG